MINELYRLSEALRKAGISTENWHRKYKPIPNVRDKAPCVRIVLSEGKVAALESVSKEQALLLRKYGSNQGTFPCMNLVPLYRITDDDVKKKLAAVKPEQLDDEMLRQIRMWCTENNWGQKFAKKYAIAMQGVPQEIRQLLKKSPFEPMQILLDEAAVFADPQRLHEAIEAEVFRMLERRENISLALTVLFYCGSKEKSSQDDTGSLSAALDCEILLDMGQSAISNRFVSGFNAVLLSADEEEADEDDSCICDAFGYSFTPVEEPMPNVKLAGGFDVTLRTMFREQHCQYRYGRIENASYPISPKLRLELQAALAWLSDNQRKNIYWSSVDKNEILFAYPHTLPKNQYSMVSPFRYDGSGVFEEKAKRFMQSVIKSREEGTDSWSDHIQIFILRKIDKARTTVIYSKLTNPAEIERQSEEWTKGCRDNLPEFAFHQPLIPFPLEVADAVNTVWKQDGTIATDKFKPVPRYRGVELHLDSKIPIQKELHLLSQTCSNLAPYLGARRHNIPLNILGKVQQQIALIGLFLYRCGIRKETYMTDFPYQYGQLLKAADELHLLYCVVVRKGDIPTQLAGGNLYQAATEAPIRTLNLLSQRMTPYITWAKTYALRNENQKGAESWRAGWLLKTFGEIASQLYEVWTNDTRLADAEKAQMFLGYLASFPGKKTEQNP